MPSTAARQADASLIGCAGDRFECLRTVFRIASIIGTRKPIKLGDECAAPRSPGCGRSRGELRASIPRTGAFAGFYFEVFAEKGQPLRLGKPGERSALSLDSKSR